jgi:hypothetical protein
MKYCAGTCRIGDVPAGICAGTRVLATPKAVDFGEECCIDAIDAMVTPSDAQN